MMNGWKLPTSLEVGGKDYQIRTDYDVILDILTALNDPDIFEYGMTDDERMHEQVMTMLRIFYIDFDDMPVSDWQEAAEKAVLFIDMGIKDDGTKKPHVMDWEQDAPVIIPAINRVLGGEVRSMRNLHWWTFLGAYMEIGECYFSNIVDVRQKLAKGKRLEKWEREFYRENKDVIELKKRKTKEELEDQAIIDEVL